MDIVYHITSKNTAKFCRPSILITAENCKINNKINKIKIITISLFVNLLPMPRNQFQKPIMDRTDFTVKPEKLTVPVVFLTRKHYEKSKSPMQV